MCSVVRNVFLKIGLNCVWVFVVFVISAPILEQSSGTLSFCDLTLGSQSAYFPSLVAISGQDLDLPTCLS